jgi:type IV secretory pathway VirB10-like protein
MATQPKPFYAGAKFPQDKRLLVAAVVIVAAIAAFYFVSTQHGPKEADKNPSLNMTEKMLYSKTEIDKLIKEQLSKNESVQKARPEAMDKPASSRKLKTAMAAFIKKEEAERPAPTNIKKSEKLGVPTGSKVKAYLANAIYSLNVTSPVIAVMDQDFTKNGKILIPKGTQFIGDAAVIKSRDRVNVRFASMVFPDGKEMKVSAMALGLDGSGGIRGKVDKQTNKSVFKAIGETLIAGGALVMGNSSGGPISLNDELRLNAARNLTDDARNSLNQVKVEESVSVEANAPIQVLFLNPI